MPFDKLTLTGRCRAFLSFVSIMYARRFIDQYYPAVQLDISKRSGRTSYRVRFAEDRVEPNPRINDWACPSVRTSN